MAKGRGGPSVASLNNVLMQMRKNCNHPDLITGPFDGGWGRFRGSMLGAGVGARSATCFPPTHPPTVLTHPPTGTHWHASQ